ncbi:MAG: choice-of-anchor I family protein [Acidobacteriota bacterium]|nr:choice-of-anchor I family protein [Acidobacteriota bacterium]
MKIVTVYRSAALLIITAFISVSPIFAQRRSIELRVLGTYSAGAYNQGASEIVAHDPATQRLFTVNGATSKIDVLSIDNPSQPTLLFSIDLAPYGRQANSVAVRNGIVAAAVEANVRTDNGKAVFFDTNGNYLNAVTVGALPDMVTFTPDGKKVLVANEGEPNNDYTIDPEGSVSIIDIDSGVQNAEVTTVNFRAFNNASLNPSIRIFGLNATVAQDLEPEYIAVSDDSRRAWVTLQENNAVGVLNLRTGQFTRLIGLGFKNHSLRRNAIDSSDRISSSIPGVIEILPRPVFGMYQPDAIATFSHLDETFFITANEGDAREYAALTEEVRINSLLLDPVVFPDATFLKTDAQIGRLNVTRTLGNFDGDPEYEALFAFGARSFSIWTGRGEQVYDSGDDIERITAQTYPMFFNASNTNNTRDDRSDNKGPEPEGVTVGEAYGRNYAFIGLERIGGILVYDIGDPESPKFVQYINNRNFMAATNTAAAGDLGPEGLHFISRRDSPTDTPLLVVANEVSGTTTVYQVARTR